MATYLVALSLGPVQSLIEAARRTRDLWCGSWLLSDAAKAAALSLHMAQRDCLVFPYTANPDEDLQPEDEPGDRANISNIIRARIEADHPSEIRRLCESAIEAAAKQLRRRCLDAKAKVPDLPIHNDLWAAQIGDILESNAAWTEIKPGEPYGEASKRLGGIHAARKATRNFGPAAEGPDSAPAFGIPKSSLDAARESVIALTREERRDPKYRRPFRKLGLAQGEQLDALALAKRLAGDPEQFTAYSRVAADSWIEDLTAEQQQAITDAYRPLVGGEDLATHVKGNEKIYRAVPFDAQLVYDFRLANTLARESLSPQEHGQLLELQRVIGRLTEQPNRHDKPVGAPVPYAVILKADGDHMGALLSQARDDRDSQAISKALAGFADSVRETVRTGRGHAIYSGGDDVLALVPLQTAIPVADALRQSFAAAMDGVAAALGIEKGKRPTLSVGLGIGHVMEPLGALRARADAAEKAAKGNQLEENLQRNALAIQLGIRSGSEYCWRARWAEDPAVEDLKALRLAYEEGKLPSRVAYDLRDIARRLKWLDEWVKSKDAQAADPIRTAQEMRRAEVRRMLDRARLEGREKKVPVPPELQKRLIERVGTEPGTLDRLADTLIIARWLAARTAADVGDRQDG